MAPCMSVSQSAQKFIEHIEQHIMPVPTRCRRLMSKIGIIHGYDKSMASDLRSFGSYIGSCTS